jgi:superfamily II RNA helicase
MLVIPDLKVDPPTVQNPFEFQLDPFQKYAISAISKDENVLITAKTGSGKTLVGEYQIYHSLKKGKRVFYTTPIKSLSNQKFHDLKKMYSSVGIMTGDIKFCPQADIVIMTTEILRNLLFRRGKEVGVPLELSLDNLDAVVFDEVHYINDYHRGKVWEECLTMLSPQINLVLLSATIDQPEHFANWLGEIKQKPIHLISTQYRVVPLVHMLPNKEMVMDSKDVYHQKVYDDWYRNYYKTLNEERKHKERVAARDSDEVVKRKDHTTSFIDRMNKLISTMELPALFFVFSRNLCSEYAKKVNQDLLTSTETAEVKHIVKFHLKDHPDINKLSQYNELIPLLEKGVAFHHSGLLPILKEIIEILFSRGFIKVLFATETFAVGINMPTKTVVFTSYRKYTDDEYRMLTTSEYIQMAGRAGRRGKDDKGIVIYLPNKEPEDPLLVKQMFTGKTISVSSQMDFGYDYILSSMFYGTDFQEYTYWMAQRIESNKKLEKQIETKKQQCPKFEDFILTDLKKRDELETSYQETYNSKGRKIQGQLEQWKNKHSSKMWDQLWKEYKKSKEIRQVIESLELDLKYNSLYDLEIDYRKELLEKFGYIEADKLTTKGILASQIHEGHPLIMSEMFANKWIHDTEVEQIVCTLSMFLENPDKENSCNEKHQRARGYAKDLRCAEQVKSGNEYWDINDYWYDPVYDWITGDDFVCEKYGIEHGNFVRAMLKLSNMVDEWVNMATITQDVEMIEKCKDIKNKIVRGFVIPDSLYLRI